MQEYLIDLIKTLDINRTIAEQENAVKSMVLRNDYDIKNLILPLDMACGIGKIHWENAAKVIFNKEENEILSVVPDLLEWLKDMNWPGAWMILDKLNSLPKDILFFHKQNALKRANDLNDEIWYENLKYLKT